jgi:hypothetical protein
VVAIVVVASGDMLALIEEAGSVEVVATVVVEG